ncbi:hypothetical protein [Streptomyces fructofermentans]|uniref:Uncharacterized protein n=1 Tax=Streptomyces fructofermentans TaxID=152141 RepID=A0A918NWC0_9ACTN|nr:hypothetical protein [Streptomyces fructofermentans]GGY00141.1 hypothetical protein GCM10010515_77600 [Streptomyces fructofermentans]
MDQATHTVRADAPPEGATLDTPGATLPQAYALAGLIIEQLTTYPRDIDICRDIDGSYGIHVMWSRDVSGVAALAAWADSGWTLVSNPMSSGVFAETRPVINGVKVWAWTLLTSEEAEQARLMMLPPEPPAAEPEPTEPAEPGTPDPQPASDSGDQPTAPVVQPLSSSVIAEVPPATGGDE